jgi:hypothetical protein
LREWPSCYNLTITAEVKLSPGVYEVLPKFSALRNTDRKKVEEVVKMAAEKNPQKLRPIGLSYGIAHVKVQAEFLEADKKRKLNWLRLSKEPKDDGKIGKTEHDTTTTLVPRAAGATKKKPEDGNGNCDRPEPDKNPWNAICVIGLRVYSNELAVKLSKPKDPRETVIVDMYGDICAGVIR